MSDQTEDHNDTMDVYFSDHALERLEARGISQDTLLAIMEHPDAIIKETTCKHVYQKVLVENKSRYLFRIFVNVCKQPPLIITAYKTSKIGKYEY